MNVQPLSALVDQRRGITYGIVQPGHHQPTGIPIVRVTDIRGGRINTGEPLRVAPDVAAKYERTRLHGGELLLTLVGTVGELAIAPSEVAGWNLARAVALIPVPPDPGARWVMYALQSGPARVFMQARLNTTVQATLNLRDVAELPVPMPDRETRERIVALLGTIDEKIELNRRMNKTLDEMGRGLFRHWFVDFDRGLPDGWREEAIGAHVTLQRGNTYKSALLGTPGPYLLGLASIARDGGFRRDKLRTYGGESPEKLLVGPGDLYLSLKDVTQSGDLLGSVARMPRSLSMGRLTQDTVKMSITSDAVDAAYLYHRLLTDEYREYCRARAIGTTNLSLSREDFLAYPIAIPPKHLLLRFSAIESNVSAQQENNDAQSSTLAELRDLLLPKLLAGELRIRDAERAVEAVA